MSKIQELITYDNILSYSKAIIVVGDLLSKCLEDGYSKVVMPSRGAFPFYYHGLTYYNNFSRNNKIFSKYLLNFKPIYLPFTADLGNIELGLRSEHIRKFWVKVLSDFINEEKSPYTFYYSNLVNIIGDSLGVNTVQLLPTTNFSRTEKKIIFIDTAISGRAICEVMDSFDHNDLKYFVILVVDQNGERLDSQFKSKIEQKQACGQLQIILVDNIISEDTTPLLNGGIGSLIITNLIERTYDSIKEFRNNSIFGCGLCFINASQSLHGQDLNSVLGTFYVLLHTFVNGVLNGKMMTEAEFDFHVNRIFDIDKRKNILDLESTKKIVQKSLSGAPQISITNSHISRLNIDNIMIQNFMDSLRPILS